MKVNYEVQGENMTITIEKLIDLIKIGKAPKKIKYNDDIFIFSNKTHDYENSNYWSFMYDVLGSSVDFIKDFLNYEVEILPEEDKEENISWEDIEKIKYKGKKIYIKAKDSYSSLNSKDKNIYLPIINQLIENQNYLKKKVDGKDG